MPPGGAGARPRVPALPAGPPACSRATMLFHLVAVNDPSDTLVVCKMSGVEVHITPNCTWPRYTVWSLRSQLAEREVAKDSAGWPENSISFVASNISVVVGGKVAALNQLVAALMDSNFFDYELLAAQPPVPRRKRFSWELAVRQPATGVVHCVQLRPHAFRILTCRGLTWTINGKSYQEFEPEDMLAYTSSGLSSPRLYWDIKWPTEGYAPGRRVQVDPVRQGLAMADPLSRIVAPRGVVMPPNTLVHDVLQDLFGDQPGDWARRSENAILSEDGRPFGDRAGAEGAPGLRPQ